MRPHHGYRYPYERLDFHNHRQCPQLRRRRHTAPPSQGRPRRQDPRIAPQLWWHLSHHSRWRPQRPQRRHTHSVRRHPRATDARRWVATFPALTEVAADVVTRYALARHTDGTTSATGSTIDYFYISTPRIMIPQYNLTSRPTKATAFLAKLSDHLAQRCTITPRPPHPAMGRAPPHVR